AGLSERPYFGWLSTRLPFYPDTLLLKTHVHLRTKKLRPYIESNRRIIRWQSGNAAASPSNAPRSCPRSCFTSDVAVSRDSSHGAASLEPASGNAGQDVPLEHMPGAL